VKAGSVRADSSPRKALRWTPEGALKACLRTRLEWRFEARNAMLDYLDEDAVASALPYDALIPAMADALVAYSRGQVLQPLRQWLTLEEGSRYLGIMPAAGAGTLGVKLVSFFPSNDERTLPSIHALVVLFDDQSGVPLALLDARTLTARRTAAVSAAMVKQLAPSEALVLAILGSGREAHSHLEAIAAVRAISEVRVWSRTPANARAFAAHHCAQHAAHALSAHEAVRDADIVVTATPARTPILAGAWLKPGALVCAIGAPMPTWRELDDAAMAERLIVESRDAARAESGDIILSGASIHAEAGEVLSGLVATPPGVTTIFKSVGMAIEDVTAAHLAYARHRAASGSRPGA